MQEGLTEGLLGELGGCSGHAGARIGEVAQRLGDAVEHEADAHACGEQQGEPCHQRKFGFVVVVTELDITEAAEAQVQAEGDEEARDEDVIPVK